MTIARLSILSITFRRWSERDEGQRKSVTTGPRQRLGWWRWPTVLSLDAPAVVLGWQAVLAHAARVRLEWPHAVVLSASVWLAYAADRWIEGTPSISGGAGPCSLCGSASSHPTCGSR